MEKLFILRGLPIICWLTGKTFVEGVRGLAFTYGLNKKTFFPPHDETSWQLQTVGNWKNFSIW